MSLFLDKPLKRENEVENAHPKANIVVPVVEVVVVPRRRPRILIVVVPRPAAQDPGGVFTGNTSFLFGTCIIP
jgi:hypothetical protein